MWAVLAFLSVGWLLGRVLVPLPAGLRVSTSDTPAPGADGKGDGPMGAHSVHTAAVWRLSLSQLCHIEGAGNAA